MIDNIPDAFNAMLNATINGATTTSPELQAKLVEINSIMVPPERLHDFVEAVYANMASAAPAVRSAAADIARFAGSINFYGLGEDQRGFKIAQALEANKTTAASPTPKEAFVLAAAPAPAPAED